MDNKCLSCSRKFPTDAGLHIHISKAHGSLEQYYWKHFPRFDKLTGRAITFRDRASYFETDFNTRQNKAEWFQSAPASEVCSYLVNFWQKRKHEKGLTKAPCQIEMRSLDMPGKLYLTKLFGSYTNFFDILGLKTELNLDNFAFPPIDISQQTIIIDTREQKPLEFPIRTIRSGLKFGDYKLVDDSFCCIERKAILDFHGTFGRDFIRFEREVSRAIQAGSYLVVVIEGSLQDLHDFSNSYIFNKPIKEAKRRTNSISSPQYVLHNMRELIARYNNLQFIFVKDRNDASKVIMRLFASAGEFKNMDLQYVYDKGELI